MMKDTAPLRDKRLFLLDMDGTIYLDDDLFDGTLDFLARVKAMGGRYMFLTNNSSKSVDKYVEKLAALGIAAAPEDFFTSTQALCVWLGQNGFADTLLYAFGTASFRNQLSAAGYRITTEVSDDVGALVMGFDTELTFRKLEDACILLGRGIPYIATNPDWVCPTAYGYVPDCGSIAQALEHATGRLPVMMGKPQPAMVQLAMKAAGATPEQTVLLGDRVYTDIAAGVNAGIDTVLVLSGEGTRADADASAQKPTWILDNIRTVYEIIK